MSKPETPKPEQTLSMTARVKTWLEKADDFLERNRRYLRPFGFVLFYVIDEKKGKMPITTRNGKYTFHRLPVGERIHIPSAENRELEKYVPSPDPNKLGQKIRIQVQYHDINGVRYQLEPGEEEIELYSRLYEKEWKGTATPG